MSRREIRALYNDDAITVYQAFHKTIAQTAVQNKTFISPLFKKERMTWIKPSFLWMMYRSGWATKQNQEHIIAIKIKRKGFEWALQNSCLSHFDKSLFTSYETWKTMLQNSPVRIQWDPERNILSQPLLYRSIQIGLSGIAVEKYITDWIDQIDDITEHCRNIHQLIKNNRVDEAKKLLPIEKPYFLSDNINFRINSI